MSPSTRLFHTIFCHLHYILPLIQRGAMNMIKPMVEANVVPRRRSVGSRSSTRSSSPVIDLAQGFAPAQDEMAQFMSEFNNKALKSFHKTLAEENDNERTTAFGLADLCPFVENGMESIVDDSFTQCFTVDDPGSNC